MLYLFGKGEPIGRNVRFGPTIWFVVVLYGLNDGFHQGMVDIGTEVFAYFLVRFQVVQGQCHEVGFNLFEDMIS